MLLNQRRLWKWGIIFFAAGVFFCGCRPSNPSEMYCFVGKRTQFQGQSALTLTFSRKFEKKSWCEAEKKRFNKQGFDTECLPNETGYDAYFRGEATGQWYLLQKIGRFPPSVIVYEFSPPLPDDVIFYNLKQMAPHAVKFAALHRAPAEVLIFSPMGEVKMHETLNAEK